MDLSIVMTYQNRTQQLMITLRSIRLQGSNPEIIIVDDASTSGQEARVITSHFPDLNIKLLEISAKDKWWINPCIPYNKGFAMATGDIVIIQNPECIYVGNVLACVTENVHDNNYVVFSCLSTLETDHPRLEFLTRCSDQEFHSWLFKLIQPTPERLWYTHPTYRPTFYHFCTALTRKNLNQIGGFNETFADGYCFDDNEFLLRIQRQELKIQSVPTTIGHVIHQWHPKGKIPDDASAWDRNQRRFNDEQAKFSAWLLEKRIQSKENTTG